MNEIQKVARAYFDGQTEDEKQAARKFFRSLDENGDGTVSLKEYKKQVGSSFCSYQIFRKLDKNGDGSLDFDEILALHYMDSVSIPTCSGCDAMLLSSSYFSCLPCLGKTSYHLCCNCYAGAGGKVRHRHSSKEFADTRALLKFMNQLMTNAKVDITLSAVPQDVDEGSEGISYQIISPSKTKIVVRRVAICVARAMVINGFTAVAASALASTGCCVM